MPEYMLEIFEKILNNSIWAFITTVVAAPILEEYLLRGVIERGLLKHTTPLQAILWSSFFFAVIHLNPWQAIGAFTAGLFLGWIYWKTRSLTACIFIHAVGIFDFLYEIRLYRGAAIGNSTDRGEILQGVLHIVKIDDYVMETYDKIKNGADERSRFRRGFYGENASVMLIISGVFILIFYKVI